MGLNIVTTGYDITPKLPGSAVTRSPDDLGDDKPGDREISVLGALLQPPGDFRSPVVIHGEAKRRDFVIFPHADLGIAGSGGPTDIRNFESLNIRRPEQKGQGKTKGENDLVGLHKIPDL